MERYWRQPYRNPPRPEELILRRVSGGVPRDGMERVLLFYSYRIVLERLQPEGFDDNVDDSRYPWHVFYKPVGGNHDFDPNTVQTDRWGYPATRRHNFAFVVPLGAFDTRTDALIEALAYTQEIYDEADIQSPTAIRDYDFPYNTITHPITDEPSGWNLKPPKTRLQGWPQELVDVNTEPEPPQPEGLKLRVLKHNIAHNEHDSLKLRVVVFLYSPYIAIQGIFPDREIPMPKGSYGGADSTTSPKTREVMYKWFRLSAPEIGPWTVFFIPPKSVQKQDARQRKIIVGDMPTLAEAEFLAADYIYLVEEAGKLKEMKDRAPRKHGGIPLKQLGYKDYTSGGIPAQDVYTGYDVTPIVLTTTEFDQIRKQHRKGRRQLASPRSDAQERFLGYNVPLVADFLEGFHGMGADKENASWTDAQVEATLQLTQDTPALEDTRLALYNTLAEAKYEKQRGEWRYMRPRYAGRRKGSQ
jgi:hypothetical protein